MKRLFDIICSFIGLLTLHPLIAIVAILVKFDSPGTIFCVQRRMGRYFKPFNLYKFGTIAKDAQKQRFNISTDRDSRITKIGKFLEKTKLNNLPLLYNVLKGDMSFVGPKPEIEEYVNLYKGDFKDILSIRPGVFNMTLQNFNDKKTILKDNSEDYYVNVLLAEEIERSKEYLRKISIIFDLHLIFTTITKFIQQTSLIREIAEFTFEYRRGLVISTYLAVFVASCYIGFFVRFEGGIPATQINLFIRYLPILVTLRIIFLYLFSLDKGMWKYVNARDVINIVMATSIGSILFFLTVRFHFGEALYPMSVFVMDWTFNIFLLSYIRMTKPLLRKLKFSIKANSDKRVIIIGAGDGAEMLIRNIEQDHLYAYDAIGIVDDNTYMKDLKIRNIPVLGTREELKSIVQDKKIDELIIAIPSLSRTEFKELLKDIRQCGLPVKSLPSLWNIMNGRGSINEIKVVNEHDILFRSPISSNIDDSGFHLNGKVIMITGAGGSIGSELSRQVRLCMPKRIILFEKHEESLYMIDKELSSLVLNEIDCDARPGLIVPVIGDILDEGRINEIMEEYHPQIVFHAAAYKHVPLMESNPCQAFKTNVLGTKMIAQKASEFGVERFVLISTDKAVNPVNVMGMTKMMAETVVSYYSTNGMKKTRNGSMRTKYVTVRFGNVLGSSGSVVPLFREQIKNGGPVTVTHPDMVRYFMTIPEAVNLVMQASGLGKGGELFVLDMGKPVKIVDLAKRMISLYGFKPNIDIDIKYMGLRAGEKLYEDLFNSHERIKNTTNQKINIATSTRSYDHIALNALDLNESSNNHKKIASKIDLTELYNKLIQSERKTMHSQTR
ncbi:MAG: polysaccharide biosynthesis protein [Candidatus Brocadiaceae bacterium]|nr:polysaccharide biosynthesis protein [Candidatus Brocadiaceae bacterium]